MESHSLVSAFASCPCRHSFLVSLILGAHASSYELIGTHESCYEYSLWSASGLVNFVTKSSFFYETYVVEYEFDFYRHLFDSILFNMTFNKSEDAPKLPRMGIHTLNHIYSQNLDTFILGVKRPPCYPFQS